PLDRTDKIRRVDVTGDRTQPEFGLGLGDVVELPPQQVLRLLGHEDAAAGGFLIRGGGGLTSGYPQAEEDRRALNEQIFTILGRGVIHVARGINERFQRVVVVGGQVQIERSASLVRQQRERAEEPRRCLGSNAFTRRVVVIRICLIEQLLYPGKVF